jgi:multidrug efflux pump subunit AcrA (membrane-fusion protein)
MTKTNKILLISGAVIVAIGIAVLLYFVFGSTAPASLSSAQVKNADITEKINLTGQVKASEGVDLAFESQGKIVANYVKVGDKIYAGQPLLATDSSILQSQLKQAKAQLDALNIDIVESRANVNLQSLYINSLSVAQKSVSTAKDILITISDIQFNHFTGETQTTYALHNAKQKAVLSLLGQDNGDFWTSTNIAQLNGGAFGLVYFETFASCSEKIA